MPTLQELQLRVTLVDEASVGIAKVKDQLGLLSESAKKSMEQLKHQHEGIGSKIKELADAATGGERAMEKYIGKFGAAGLAFASFAGVIGIGLHSLKEFAERVTDLANKAKVIGMEPATMQNIIEQYEQINISAGVVQTSLAGLASTLADLGRIGSEKRREIIELGGSAFGPQMERDIQKIELLGSVEEKWTQIITNSWNIYNNRLEQTHGDVVDAAELQNRYLRAFGLDPSVKLLTNVAKLTEERKKAIDARNKAAADFQRTMTQVSQQLREIVDDVLASALKADGPIIQGLERILELIKEFRAEWNKPWTAPVHPQGSPPAVQPQGPAPPISGPRPGEMGPAPPISRLMEGTASGGGGTSTYDVPGFNKNWDWMRRSENIEDRREEGFSQGEDYIKVLEENTAQVRKMNENFKLLDAGQVELKGLGALPGFGGAGATGSYGPPSAPNGSSVGPGAGRGAGESHPATGTGGGTAPATPPPDPGGAVLRDPMTGKLGGGLGDYRSGGGGHRHQGIDILGKAGSPIYSVGAGTVISHNPHGSYQGDAVTTVRLDDGRVVRYMHHNLDPNLKVGSTLEAGQPIGTSGTAAGVDHLHFEIWRGKTGPGGQLLDPEREFGWKRGPGGRTPLGGHPINEDRDVINAASAPKGVRTVKVETNGKLTADVNAPRGADVKVEGGGAFSKTETNRTMPLDAD